MNKVGTNDDFYEIGGDSLSSMEVLAVCGLTGLNVYDIFIGRTPHKIAKLYNEGIRINDAVSIDEINSNSMKSEHPLTIEQQYMLNHQLLNPD